MTTKIEANGNGIMSGDVIYINKRNSKITSVIGLVPLTNRSNNSEYFFLSTEVIFEFLLFI